MGSIQERWAGLDDGTMTAVEVGNRMGCSGRSVTRWRKERREREKLRLSLSGEGEEVELCSNCGFPESEKVPVGADKLCLWCRGMALGVDLASFYMSGAWQEVVEWRGDGSRGDSLRDLIRGEKERRGEEWVQVARWMGVSLSVLSNYLRGSRTRITLVIAEGFGDYLGMSGEQVLEMARQE